MHELIHVRRWDPWVRTAQIVLQTLYFFHPLVWWVNRQIHRERELCCDDAVVRYYGGARRQYVETLLRCASSSRVRSPLRSITIPTLGVAGAVSRVNRRIRRMLNQNYRVPTTLSRWAVALILSAMVAATVLAGAASPEARGHGGLDPGQLSSIQTVGAYFVTDDSGKVDWDRRLAWSGDLEIGKQLEGPRFDAVEIPESVSGTVRIRCKVDTEGRVSAADVLAGIEPAVDQAFLDAARVTTFAPSTHKAYGAVGIEVVFVIDIEPPSQPMMKRASQGGEVVELVRAQRPGELRGERVDLEGLPRYLPIRGRDPFPIDARTPVSADYSFGLMIDQTGSVERADVTQGPLAFTPQRELIGEVEEWCAVLSEWLLSFRFDPLVHSELGPVRAYAMLDLRANEHGVEIATYAPPSEDWRRQLASLYSLDEDQALRLIPTPFADGRLDLFRSIDPGGARRHPDGPSSLILQWSDDGLEEKSFGRCYGRCQLFVGGGPKDHGVVLRELSKEHGPRIEIGPGLAEHTLGSGDVVMRSGAALAELLDSFAAELERLLHVRVGWDSSTQPQKVIVMRGRFGEIARDPALNDQTTLHLYHDEKDPDPKRGSSFTASDGESLAKAMQMFLDVPVIDETLNEPHDSFRVRLHRSARNTVFVESVLRNLEAQSDLQLSLEKRPTEVVRFSFKE